MRSLEDHGHGIIKAQSPQDHVKILQELNKLQDFSKDHGIIMARLWQDHEKIIN